jgi:hypothetical protein
MGGIGEQFLDLVEHHQQREQGGVGLGDRPVELVVLVQPLRRPLADRRAAPLALEFDPLQQPQGLLLGALVGAGDVHALAAQRLERIQVAGALQLAEREPDEGVHRQGQGDVAGGQRLAGAGHAREQAVALVGAPVQVPHPHVVAPRERPEVVERAAGQQGRLALLHPVDGPVGHPDAEHAGVCALDRLRPDLRDRQLEAGGQVVAAVDDVGGDDPGGQAYLGGVAGTVAVDLPVEPDRRGVLDGRRRTRRAPDG